MSDVNILHTFTLGAHAVLHIPASLSSGRICVRAESNILMIVTFSYGDTVEGICACSFSVSQFRRASSSHSACILSQNSVSDCTHQRERERGHSSRKQEGRSGRWQGGNEWIVSSCNLQSPYCWKCHVCLFPCCNVQTSHSWWLITSACQGRV